MKEYLIRNANLLGERVVDIHVADGQVVAVGEKLSAPGAIEVNASGLIALPGLVDPHTHLREPGREDAETVLTGSLYR